MTINDIWDYLETESWTVNIWSEHLPEGVYYTAKVDCACQARGRYKCDGDTLEKTLQNVYDEVVKNWG